ncbi:MAG: DUF3108 domain-containing protein [Bdellovibrionales bacterium]
MRRFIALVIALLVALMPMAAGFAQPSAPRAKKAVMASRIPQMPPIMTTYEIYIGGIHFLTANILFRREAGSYDTHLHARTAGYLYKVLKWDGDVSSTGRIKGDRLSPVKYRNIDTWKDKPKTTELHFDGRGNIKAEFNPPNTDTNRETVTEDQMRGALDPATALVQMLAHVAVNQSCTLEVPVFDGKRRFDLRGEDGGKELIDETDYGIYKGAARLCNVSFEMIAGEWKDREKNRFWERAGGGKGRDAFHIWLGNVAPEVPEIPVKLTSTSAWGDIVGHLTEWHVATSDDLKAQ